MILACRSDKRAKLFKTLCDFDVETVGFNSWLYCTVGTSVRHCGCEVTPEVNESRKVTRCSVKLSLSCWAHSRHPSSPLVCFPRHDYSGRSARDTREARSSSPFSLLLLLRRLLLLPFCESLRGAPVSR